MPISKNCLVTITDNISPTSMPYNEFVLYRLRHYPNEKQVLILLFKNSVEKGIEIPDGVETYIVGKSLIKLRRIVGLVKKRYDHVSFHIHEAKSVVFFYLSTFLHTNLDVIYTLHSTYKNYPFHNKLLSACASFLATNIVCVSKTSYKYYPNILKRIRGNHVLFIQNGVDTERINAVENRSIKIEDIFTIVYVARLTSLKRHCILFDAIKNISCTRLCLIGKGPLEEQLKQEALQKGIQDKVIFLGLQPREDVYHYLKRSDLYVSSSSYEGLPIGVLEAMGCGIPCLVSDIEQHAEIAENCPSLMLCSDDINDWATQISRIKEMSNQERQSIGNSNQKAVNEYFSLASMHRNYDRLYGIEQQVKC